MESVFQVMQTGSEDSLWLSQGHIWIEK